MFFPFWKAYAKLQTFDLYSNTALLYPNKEKSFTEDKILISFSCSVKECESLLPSILLSCSLQYMMQNQQYLDCETDIVIYKDGVPLPHKLCIVIKMEVHVMCNEQMKARKSQPQTTMSHFVFIMMLLALRHIRWDKYEHRYVLFLLSNHLHYQNMTLKITLKVQPP